MLELQCFLVIVKNFGRICIYCIFVGKQFINFIEFMESQRFKFLQTVQVMGNVARKIIYFGISGEDVKVIFHQRKPYTNLKLTKP